MRQWSNQHWFRQWLVAWSAPSHYQNQCWNIVSKTLRNKLQWIFSRNSNIFIQENAFESVVCEKAAILSRPQWVNSLLHVTRQWKRMGLSGCPCSPPAIPLTEEVDGKPWFFWCCLSPVVPAGILKVTRVIWQLGSSCNVHLSYQHIEGILPKGPYLPCVSMAGRALLAGYHWYTCLCVIHWNEKVILMTFSSLAALKVK